MPEEKPTPEEEAEVEKARAEISEGRRIPLDEILIEVG